jgi:hypothetical protein
MISKQHVPDLIRDGNRFSDRIMRKQKSDLRRAGAEIRLSGQAGIESL